MMKLSARHHEPRTTHHASRNPFLHNLLLLILAGAGLGLAVALAFLESWATLGISWGPDLTPVAYADVQPPLSLAELSLYSLLTF